MSRSAQTGKLAARQLERLLGRYAQTQDPSVRVGPRVGLDAAAVAAEAGTLVLASDPVTYTVADLGAYAVHVNANDVFVSGAEPRWFLADILLPPGRGRLAGTILRQIHAACKELGVALVGGHTEMTPGLPRAMVAGFMIGQAVGDTAVTAAGVRPGDIVILTKAAAIEGTAVIAREFSERLARRVPAATLRRATGFLRRPGLSVGPEARIAARHGAHAMHDPTEGGVLNGLWEMAQASSVVLDVRAGAIRVETETRAICEPLGIDPLRLLASGALLVAAAPDDADAMLNALGKTGVSAARIGRARAGRAALRLDSRQVVRQPVVDEVLKLL